MPLFPTQAYHPNALLGKKGINQNSISLETATSFVTEKKSIEESAIRQATTSGMPLGVNCPSPPLLPKETLNSDWG